MGFLAVIIAFLISSSLSGHGEPVTQWAHSWRRLILQRGWGVKLSAALFLLLPVALLAGLLMVTDNGLVNFVISVAVLLLAFKSGDQPEHLAYYQQKVADGDDQEAWNLAVTELGLEAQMYEPGDEAMDEGVQAGLAYQFLQRFFVSVFWFVAFGAPGVLLVWLMSVALKGEEVDAFCFRLKHALYWIPVRLMALSLGFMGDFSRCFNVWLEQVRDFERDDRVLLISCLRAALGAVNSDDMLHETLNLLKRTQLAWLVALALLLIFGF